MVSITVSVPEDVKEKMGQFPEMNWSGFVRKAITEKVEQLSWKEGMLRQLVQEKDLEEWAVKLQKSARKGRLEELKKKGLV